MYDGTIIGVKSMYASQIESNKKNNISINKVIYREWLQLYNRIH